MKVLYSIIRYVPDNVRGEFINVGAIVSGPRDTWAWRITKDWSRAARLDTSLVENVQKYLEDVEDDVAAWVKEGGLLRLRSVWRNLVQISEPLPMIAESMDKALDWAMQQFVAISDSAYPVKPSD